MKNILWLLVCLAFLPACKKDAVDFDFNVTTAGSSFKAGQDIVFTFSGNPDNITFYSGEPGTNYANRDRTSIKGTPKLDFTSLIKNGVQTNALALLVSTDFPGIYDSTHVVDAAWTDITDRATLSTGVDNTPSGTIDLTDVVVEGKPLYIAFKFTGQAGSSQKSCVLRTFNVVNYSPDDPPAVLTDINNAGWLAVNLLGAVKWSIAANIVRIDGATGATAPANLDYVITKALYPGKVQPDIGLALKNMSSLLTSYTYHYDTPGTYKIAFVASNMRPHEGRTVVKEMTITVTP
jgi:hypothetical protein